MTDQNPRSSVTRRPSTRHSLLLIALAAAPWACGDQQPGPLGAAGEPLTAAPSLGTAQSFAVLAASTLTNTGATIIAGDIGVSPGNAITGFPPGIVTGGTVHAGDAAATQAQADVTTAYDALAGDACNVDLTGQDLGGLTLTPGVYCFSSSAQLTGTLTLDAQGNSGAVFVFQIGSTLTTASHASVMVVNGAEPCNVFWQVGSSATLGTGTAFTGDILALTSITLTTGAGVAGRALARNGAVTLDTNPITAASCAAQQDAGTGGAAGTDGGEPAGCQAHDWMSANQGYILGTPSGHQGDFVFGAGIRGGALKGFLYYDDNYGSEHVVATDVTSYVVTGPTSRRIQGDATVDGAGGFSYTIDATDNGANDFFSISVSDGYHASGGLSHIQLSVQTCP